jgi:hypothetical protein
MPPFSEPEIDRQVVRRSYGLPEVKKNYKEHLIEVWGSMNGYKLVIDGFEIQGRFTGVGTAVQRGVTLIDRIA